VGPPTVNLCLLQTFAVPSSKDPRSLLTQPLPSLSEEGHHIIADDAIARSQLASGSLAHAAAAVGRSLHLGRRPTAGSLEVAVRGGSRGEREWDTSSLQSAVPSASAPLSTAAAISSEKWVLSLLSPT
jgi:hypothetical protein